MGRVYRAVFDGVLTHTDAEAAHRGSFRAWRGLSAIPGSRQVTEALVGRPDPALAVPVFGKTVASPLGLAAGFDKNAVGIDALARWGFGAIEIGTVTGQAQPGNDRPRLFRLPADRAIVNRMGFNNDGSAVVADRLARRAAGPHRTDILLGINIGKTKAVDAADAVADYVLSARRLAPYADYLVVNVSSPNTPGLRDLQAVETLRPLLVSVREAADTAAARKVPLLVKIAPDLADDDIVAVAALVAELELAGVVATNTTISREGLASAREVVERIGPGGLSGPVLRERSMGVLRLLRAHLPTGSVVISVGGVSTAADVRARLVAGATLVQAYTAFVYEGPLWVSRVNRALSVAQGGDRR
jgi:dihydroorotate dehydrogenase